jgi:hypothetical protein
MQKNLLIICLLEAVFYLLFWLFSPDAAYILTCSISAVSAAILVISLIADAIEASKIGRIYYYALLISVFLPLFIYGVISFFTAK